MTRISEILKNKSSEVYKIESDDTVHRAAKMMAKHSVGALLVYEDDTTCGIITERDILRTVAKDDLPLKDATVSEIMTKDLVCVSPDFPVEECMAIMTEKRIRHLPVMEGKKFMGIVSIGDLIKQQSKDQKTHIRYLTDYITGKYPA